MTAASERQRPMQRRAGALPPPPAASMPPPPRSMQWAHTVIAAGLQVCDTKPSNAGMSTFRGLGILRTFTKGSQASKLVVCSTQ